MKYSKIYIGVLNHKNIHKLEQYQQLSNTQTVLFSNIDFFDLTAFQLDLIRNNSYIVVPTKEIITKANQYKKSPKYALFVDWLLRQPTEAKFLLANDSLLHVAHHDEAWHDEYGGGQGYAISCHEEDDLMKFYGHSASLPGGSDKLILKVFNGCFLKDANNNS